MFGAREVKSVSRFAREHAGEWKPIHSSLIACLQAHRNPQSGRCCPSRRLMAEYCNVSERTIDRAIAQLRSWGAIRSAQLRAVGRPYAMVQYTLLFHEGGGETAPVREQKPRKPSGYTQSDFDERDLRKLNAELDALYRSLAGARIVDSEYERELGEGSQSHERIFSQACARAGISVERGLQLEEAESKRRTG